MSELTLDEAIKHCLEKAEENDNCANKCEAVYGEDNGIIEACRECAEDHRQLAEWLTELKELKKLTVINPIIAGYNEVYEKLIKGDIEESNDKGLLKTAVDTLENVMPKYRRLSEENQKQKEQIAEYKRLLKAAVEDFSGIYDHIFDCDGMCDTCPIHGNRDTCDKWARADEALALIGGESDD